MSPASTQRELREHLRKMLVMADGAQRALSRPEHGDDPWNRGLWEGYRQAVSEVQYLLDRQPAMTEALKQR